MTNPISLAPRVRAIKPSPTLAVTTKARELKAAGKDVISLGAGEPDFDTPYHIKQAAIRAIEAGFTKYTAVDGTPELKQAVIAKFVRENDLSYRKEQVLVSAGAKHSLFNLFLALLGPGDEVVIPAPYWVSYPDMVLLADARPVIVSGGMEQGFKITPEQLDSAITARTKLFVLNSPSNPTGVAYSRNELAALGEVLLKHPQVFVVTDDIYEHIQWTGEPFRNIVNACPKLIDRSVVVNGVSKAYAMTGWRIGYAAGPQALIKAMENIQSQSTSNPTSIAQVAATAALSGDQSCIGEMVREFHKRHDHVVARLNAIRGVHCLNGQGTFYSFADFREAMAARGVSDDVALAANLMEEAGVALVPGTAFGAPGFLRLSFATDLQTLNGALDRLEKVFGRRG
jgi:aspartate aminotransferase